MDKATFATWRTAEFGFLGDIVVTFVTTPFTWGLNFKAGVLDEFFFEYQVRAFACLSVAILEQIPVKIKMLVTWTQVRTWERVNLNK